MYNGYVVNIYEVTSHMAKVKPSSMPKPDRERAVSGFLDLVTNLRTKTETVDFLLGILTPSEALMLSRRLQIAERMLREETTIEEIRQELGVGIRTIYGVDRWLHSGNDDRDAWLANLIRSRAKGAYRAGKGLGSRKGYSMSLLDRYPQHRILTDLISEILR